MGDQEMKQGETTERDRKRTALINPDPILGDTGTEFQGPSKHIVKSKMSVHFFFPSA